MGIAERYKSEVKTFLTKAQSHKGAQTNMHLCLLRDFAALRERQKRLRQFLEKMVRRWMACSNRQSSKALRAALTGNVNRHSLALNQQIINQPGVANAHGHGEEHAARADAVQFP